MSDTAERLVFRVRWDSKQRLWCVWLQGERIARSEHNTKATAISSAALFCRGMRESEGTPSELFIHTKRGRIGERRTYGRDPRRRKG